MSVVFADTVGLLAMWNRDDQWHQQARAALQQLQKLHAVLYTTTFVLLECGNAAARTPFRSDVCRLRQTLAIDGTLIEPTTSDWDLAWISFERWEGGNAGIVDQVSFQVMRRLGLTSAFTNDSHFRAAGFETLF
jgi:uncharacterized protein